MIVIFDEDSVFLNGPGTAFGGIMGGSVSGAAPVVATPHLPMAIRPPFIRMSAAE
jgi:hypothetical protein